MSYRDAQGAPAGFAVDLITSIANEAQLDLELVMKPRAGMFNDFYTDQVDALGCVVHTREREKTMAFSVTALELKSCLFVRKGGPEIQSVEDLRKYRIAVLPNTRGHAYLQSQDLLRYMVAARDQSDALSAVAEGRADVTLGTRLLVLVYLRDYPLKNVEISDVSLPGLSYPYHIALHVGDAARLAKINEALARLHANGTFDQLYEKWIGPLEPRPLRFQDIRRYLLPAALLLAAIIAAFFWQRKILRRLARQAEKLRLSEEQLTLVLEGSQDGFWDWDLRTGHIARSERLLSMLGYGPDEIEPTLEAGLKLVHPDDLLLYQNRKGGPDTPDRTEVEYRMKSKSGEWRWILDRGKIVARSPEGTPLRMAGTHTDITKRKYTEAALRESELLLKRSAQFLAQTQSAAHIGGWEMDVRTAQLFWTEETYKIHGTTATTFNPTLDQVLKFYSPASQLAFATAVEKARNHGTPFDLELEVAVAGQPQTVVQATGRAVLENGRVTKLYGSICDITDRKLATDERDNLQRKMVEAQKLESLGVLAGGIAHDFNNLLTVILANASLARISPDDTNAPAEPGHNNELLAQIENAARRAADMCRQMLAYAGKGSFLIERIDLSALVQDTARLLSISISKNARLEFALDPRLPPINADNSQMRQVVMNLLINAAEALGDTPGKIRISTYRGRPGNAAASIAYSFDVPPGDCACLDISDTGCGMDAETLARIFDPFFSTKFTGRGLGLASVLGIVRAHHGALSVRSTKGQGTVFSLCLPLAPEEFPSAQKSREPPRTIAISNKSILIADDEPTVLLTASGVLRRYGYTTILAKDGSEAVELFRANPQGFTAVLLDLTMPGLNGAEALRQIRALNPDIHALLMSGYSTQEVLKHLKGMENVAILQKPFSQESLIASLHQAIAST